MAAEQPKAAEGRAARATHTPSAAAAWNGRERPGEGGH